nr:MAG TPA: PD-(D/E)XK nuclease superfamily protein [Caudoviricetes sp.]
MTDIYLPESYGDVLVDAPELGPGERLHSMLGASGTERWMNCPGSIRMSKGMPNKSSIYAMEGTAAHALGEKCLIENVSADVYEGMWINLDGETFETEQPVPDGERTIFYDGQLLWAKNPHFKIDEAFVKAVQLYLDTVDFYLDWARKTFNVEPQLFIEKGFSLEEVWPGMFGTNDVCIYVPGHCLIVIDYKHGRGKVVEIKNNTQLRYYGLGGLIELCANPADLPEEVVTVVVQPRASHRDGLVRAATYATEEINVGYRAELIEAAKETEKPDAELNPGDWCFFCPGKIKCPKITGKFTEMSKVDHYDLSDDELADPMKKADVAATAVANITTDPALLGRFLAFIPILESVIKGVEEYALDQALAGHVPPGQKVVRKDTKRKYRDEEAAGRELLAAGFEPKEIYDLKLKSASALKRLGAAKWKKIDPILTAGDHVYKPEGAYTLAPLDDERPEVPMTAFDDLDASDLMIAPPADDAFDIM